MNNIKAIGGYFELDGGGGTSPLPKGVLLNSCRNALRHIVRKLQVKCVHVPHYICPVVIDALVAEECAIEWYSIGVDMLPSIPFNRDDFILYVNYFGVCGRSVEALFAQYPNLIVDCAQAYFAKPKGCACFSSPRKFFGVPDGGVAYGVDGDSYEDDVSDNRIGYLIERREHGATPKEYALFRKAESSLDGADVKRMSRFTKERLSQVDMNNAKARRIRNFAFLQHHLPTTFPLALADDDVPMVYPYITNNSRLRSLLIQEKIYVASYWPGVSNCGDLQERILPLPIDQRYDEKDMEKIVEVVKNA